MKKLLVIALFLNAALMAGRFWQELPVACGRSGPVAAENGDVNGDGTRDISDALYTLFWLFEGGPAPVALADSPELSARVEALEEILTTEKQEILDQISIQHIDDGFGGQNKTIRLTGVNLQIVNGVGNSYSPINGVGNLIIGYNERVQAEHIDARGSHNLIIGRDNSYFNSSGIIHGNNNSLGGQGTFPHGVLNVIVGSQNSFAGPQRCVVVGGAENTCRSELGVIVGGSDNMTVVAGPGATITGGRSNTATAWMSSIGGGLERTVSGEFDWQAGSLFEDQ